MSKGLLVYRANGRGEGELDLKWADQLGLTVRAWTPAQLVRGPAGASWTKYRAYCLLSMFGAFSRPGLRAIQLGWQGSWAHRSVLFPRHWRFPFMAEEDLQIGDVWTAMGWRGMGLAGRVVASVVNGHAENAAVWWLCDEANIASRRLAEKGGMVLFGMATFHPAPIVPAAGWYRLQ